MSEESTVTETRVIETNSDASQTGNDDEEYIWLTERLDAHTNALVAARTEMLETRSLMTAQMEALKEQSQMALSESRTLIESLTSMVNTMSQTLATLAASAMLSSLPNNSPTEPESPPQEQIVVVPENNVQTPEINAAPEAQRKRRHL